MVFQIFRKMGENGIGGNSLGGGGDQFKVMLIKNVRYYMYLYGGYPQCQGHLPGNA